MLTVDNFMTIPNGYANWYARYRLIDKALTPEKVVNMLNKLYPKAEYEGICDGRFIEGKNDYSMVSFTISKGEQTDIIKMTTILDCIGYVEIPWNSRPPVGYKSGKKYLHCSVEADGLGTPYDDDDEEYISDEKRIWDCSVAIRDSTSDITFYSGGGYEDYDTMLAYQDFVGEHKEG